MAENSKIEWTHHTFNAWRGCTKVAPGCQYCYADDLSKRNPGTLGIWGPSGTRVVASKSMWRQPLKWDAAAKAAGERHRVFCASLADVFEDYRLTMRNSRGDWLHHADRWGKSNPQSPYLAIAGLAIGKSRVTMNDVRRRLFHLCAATPNLDKLLLTKRPENIPQMIEELVGIDWWKANCAAHCWLGTSISDQATADRNIPLLLKCGDLSPVLFLSAEPLLGPVDLEKITLRDDGQLPNDLSRQFGDYICPLTGTFRDSPHIDWLIAGGESGHHARPMHPDWVRSLRDQCQAAGVPFLFKQWGEWMQVPFDDDNQAQRSQWEHTHLLTMQRWLNITGGHGFHGDNVVRINKVGKAAAGRMLDGKLWDQYPTTAGNVSQEKEGAS